MRSDDLGASWTDIGSNLPEESPVNEIDIDPLLQDHYYLATDIAVFFSPNGGDYWERLGDELPPTLFNDLDLHNERRQLLAASYGRSMFTYDLPTEPVSVDETDFSNLINVYPNPTTDLLNIDIDPKMDISEIVLIDNSGRVLRTIANNETQVDVSDLNPGSYRLRIMTDLAVISKQFVAH